MPARTFSSVLLPAPLWPMMPSRWPSPSFRLTPWRAFTSIIGLTERRNIWRTTNSLSVIRPWRRSLNVRSTWSSSIRAITIPSLISPCPRTAALSQLEDQPPLQPGQHEAGDRGDAQDHQRGGGERVERGHGPLEDRLAHQLEHRHERVEIDQPAQA